MPNSETFVIATAPPLPERMRGSAGVSATARSGDAVSFFFDTKARERNPSSVDFTPGVPHFLPPAVPGMLERQFGMPANPKSEGDVKPCP